MKESNQLQAIVERIETQNAQIAEETAARKEIYEEAKALGYDVKIIRKIVAIRKRRADDLAEEEALMDTYKSALGMS